MGQGCGSQAAPALESGRGRLAVWRRANRHDHLPRVGQSVLLERCLALVGVDGRKGGKPRANEWRTEIATRGSAHRDY
jgi:hypothetical protein